MQAIQKITSALTLWFGASLVMDGELTIGGLIAFNMLAGRVAQPIIRLAQLWQDFQQARISIERLGDILNTKPEPSAQSRTALPALKGAVEFKDVVFRYRPDLAPVLKGISLNFAAGQVVGIVGPSGSGKSTLTKLVQCLYLPESGRVLVDDMDLSSADPAWLRRQIGVVLQENWLFNRSVKDNIALSDPSISLDRVVQAAQIAGAHEFISELPEGYDTIISERGVSLSGGQRQRIAIARNQALLSDQLLASFAQPSDTPQELIIVQKALLQSQQQEHAAKIDALKSELAKERAELKTTDADLTRLKNVAVKILDRKRLAAMAAETITTGRCRLCETIRYSA